MHESKKTQVTMMILAALLAGLTAIGGRLSIPVFGVPMTMQTFFVYFSGVLLGARWGLTAQALYILMGLVGLPVFANGTGGPGIIFEPTFGFLVGFVVSAGVTGYLVERWGRRAKPMLLAAFLGMVVVFVFGIVGFSLNMVYVAGKSIPLGKTLAIFAPFVALDCLKLSAAAVLAEKIHARLAARSS